MDDVVATGFAAAAGAYQDARPSWPLDAVDAAFGDWRRDSAGAPSGAVRAAAEDDDLVCRDWSCP
jgi:hypothetical protein